MGRVGSTRGMPLLRTYGSSIVPAQSYGRAVRGFNSTAPVHASAAAGTSKRRALPNAPNPYPLVLFTVVFAVVSWTGFTLVSTNQERTASSIFKDVVIQVKTSPRVHALMFAPPSGTTTTTSTTAGSSTTGVKAPASSSQSPIVLKHEWWLGGAPYVRGTVGMMKGRIDLSFKITTLPSPHTNTTPQSPPRTATVYFTSIRAEKSSAFEIIRFLVVQDDPPHESASLLDAPSVPTNMLLA